MKTIKLSIIAMLLLTAVACKKNNNTSPGATVNVSTSDAADMVAGSLAFNSNGLVAVSNDATNVGTSLSLNSIGVAPGSSFPSYSATINSSANAKVTLACGTTISDSVSRQSTPGSAITYSYNLDYNFTLNCSNNVPSDLSSILTYNGSFSGPNLSSTNTGSSDFTVTGLSPQATDFVINGEYKRAGSFQSKIDTAIHGTHNIDIVVNALTLIKPARTIVSGTATITVTGNVPKKGNFSYTGTLKFNNDGTADLTISGTVYSINLITGVAIKV